MDTRTGSSKRKSGMEVPGDGVAGGAGSIGDSGRGDNLLAEFDPMGFYSERLTISEVIAAALQPSIFDEELYM
jgi:hypothetical protein